MQKGEHFPYELRIEQGFTAGKSHSAAVGVKHIVFQKERKQFCRGTGSSADFQCVLPAGFHAFAAQGTTFSLKVVFSSGKNMDSFCANSFAFPAPVTEKPVIKQLSFPGKRFRIMAPQTVQRTPFNENGRPCPGTVMQGQTADICDKNPVHISEFSFCFTDQPILLIFGQVDKAYIPAAETNLKVPVFIRGELCFFQLINGKNVEMDEHAAIIEKGLDEIGNKCRPFRTGNSLRQKDHVQYCSVREIGMVNSGKGLKEAGDPF
jgi:hypothetical protein